MNILITFLNYNKDVFGGIENATNNLVYGLKLNGHNVSVYSGLKSNGSDNYDSTHIYRAPYLTLSFDGKDDTVINHLTSHKKDINNDIKKIIKEKRIELIVCVDHLWGIIPVLGLRYNIPTVVWFHVFHNQHIIKELNKTYNEFYAVSNFLAEKISPIVKSRIKILPNSIVIKQTRERKKLSNEIFVNARISPEKRTLDAIDCFDNVANKFKETYLVLCGGKFPFINNEKYLRKVEKRARNSMYKDRIVFERNIPWELIPEKVVNARVILLPTETESFGMAALEAMVYKTPLITTSVGNLPFLTRGLVPLKKAGDVDGLTKELLEELSGSRKSNLYELNKIGKRYAAPLIAREFISKIEKQ